MKTAGDVKHLFYYVVVFFFLFLSLTKAQAQDEYSFKEGLLLNGVHRYGREALYNDLLAYQLYTGELKTPAEGVSTGLVNTNGEDIRWQKIKADSANRFRTRGGFGGSAGGYLYFTYNSPTARVALLNISGNNAVFFNGELHAGDPYGAGWLYIPVKLKRGLNELFVRSGGLMTVKLIFPGSPLQIAAGDATLPSIVLGESNTPLKGGVVVINANDHPLSNARLQSKIGENEINTSIPSIPPLSSRKVMFAIDASAVTVKGQQECTLSLLVNGKKVDEKKINLDAVDPTDKYSVTFISDIDGSLQYYAVSPQKPAAAGPSALFLSVHGAGVEALGQARAYKQKEWGNLVAATNRRPRGFNWEDWGRLDALEVLALAKEKFKPDPQRIYLTGHSMGGHGTWFLGATYPDQWAAIAPCAGYPTLKGYGSADGLVPDSGATAMEQMLLRSSNQSDVPKLATNYKPLGVYIFHGDSDRTVPVTFARQMKKLLADFHSDISYYEYPGGEHWFGDKSVDWQPLFDFFKWHQIAPDSSFDIIDFTTASPGISSSYRWMSVQQQVHPLQYSRVQLKRDRKERRISGTAENVALLKIKLDPFETGTTVRIQIDSLNTIEYRARSTNDSVFLKKDGMQWTVADKPASYQKGPQRYGTFKDPFNHRMVFVYGTKGNAAENNWSYSKARYDAETWYYRGNGAVDIIADKDFSLAAYESRNVIIYGNSNTNGAYNLLLKDCPIQVERNRVTAGDNTWQGDDLGAYITWPLPSSAVNVVGLIGGTGLRGMQAVNANQYFAGASGFPDFMIYRLRMIKEGSTGVKMAGFFGNEWQLTPTEFVVNP